MVEIRVRVRTLTPVVGGGAVPQAPDPMVLRPQSLSGHLRFWWRATVQPRPNTGSDWFERETRIFGGVRGNVAIRSAVETSVCLVERTEKQTVAGQAAPGQADPRRYAVWPLLQGEGGAVWLPPGCEFVVSVRCPRGLHDEVRRAVQAWILFGGVGGRTRRGLGALTVSPNDPDRSAWLPAQWSKEEIQRLFGVDLFAAGPTVMSQTPSLVGAGLVVGSNPRRDAEAAWKEALSWLREFRQGEGTARRDPRAARESGGGGGGRPGRSNWPEADKLRRLHGRWPIVHAPRHNADPVWPRASFGLPLQVRFQNTPRGMPGERYDPPEPADRFLLWQDATLGQHGRLASPLIVRPAPRLHNGDDTFLPIALWLDRSFPGGQVGIENRRGGVDAPAPFDALVAPGDAPCFAVLGDPSVAAAPPGRRMRRAFFLWLRAKFGAGVVEISP